MTIARGEQPALPGVPGPRTKPRRAPKPVADVDPVAAVQIDAPVPHLDRVFDYLVPAELSADAQPGVRVRVSLAGRQLTGFVIERKPVSEHTGSLRAIGRVVSPVPVLSPPVLRLARAVAERYAGTVSDVLRLAVPPRHGTVERAELQAQAAAPLPLVTSEQSAAADYYRAGWRDYLSGPAFDRRVAKGEAPWAVWSALPWTDTGGGSEPAWPRLMAAAVLAAVAAGRGAIVVAPTLRDVMRLEVALAAAGVSPTGGRAVAVRLVAEDGPAARYRSFLAALTGRASVVIGTRAAAYAPVARPGLLAIWDEGNDLLGEPRAPYPHTRTVLQLRAEMEHCALLLAGHARSVDAQLLVAHGRAASIQADRALVRIRTPRMAAPGAADLARYGAEGQARIPPPAWRLIEQALARGPVLIQVPCAGYTPVLACARCGQLARCPVCGEAMSRIEAGAPVTCPNGCEPHVPPPAGAIPRSVPRNAGFRCSNCGAEQVRAVRVGAARLAEELGRAFPGTVVRLSGAGTADGVLREVPATPCLVIATQGAEPWAPGGYAAALSVDAHVLSDRTELHSGQEALRRWIAAAALVRPAPLGGQAMLLGRPAPAPAGAFVRWDPVGFAERELAERRSLGLPPATRLIRLAGNRPDVRDFLARLELPAGSNTIGPNDQPGQDGQAEAFVMIDPQVTDQVVRAVGAESRARSARRAGVVRVQVDPPALT